MFAKESSSVETPPFYALDWLPVFTIGGSQLKTSGPALIAAPKLSKNEETYLKVLELKKDNFDWRNIDPPTKPDALESLIATTPPTILVELETKAVSTWTTASVRANDDKGISFIWKDAEPSTKDVSEAENLGFAGAFAVGALIDWSSAPSIASQEGFVTRGAIAANGQKLYSHGWHYVYSRHDGSIPSQMTPLVGSKLTRWPCVLVYDLTKNSWEKAWAPLDTSGNVKSEWLPDPETLLVDSNGTLYSRTKEAPRKLLTLSSDGRVTVGDQTLSDGALFLYQDVLHQIQAQAILNLKTNQTINFDTLVHRIPEIYGPLSIPPEGEGTVVENDEFTIGDGDNLGAGAAVTNDATEIRTVRVETNLKYSIPTRAKPATDGKNLWILLEVEGAVTEPSYPLFGISVPENWKTTTLARYDGERWQILPHGLRALMDKPSSGGLSAPIGAANPVCARYPELPEQIHRYAVVSIDTDPFEFK